MKPTEIINEIMKRLPHKTQALIKVLGWDGTLLFLRRNGRDPQRKLYIPAKYNPRKVVFKGMTQSDAQKLINSFGGEYIDITSHRRMLASERYQLLADDYQYRAFTIKMLCAKYNMHHNTVSWVIRKYEL